MTNIRTEIEAYKPTLAANYKAMAERTFAAIVAMHGADVWKAVNCWTYAKAFNNFVRPLLVNKTIDAGRLDRAATQYANDTAEAWIAKIESKLGDLTDVTVERLGGVSFVIRGTRDGHAVRINQDMTFKASSRGTPFNQFPARIYVDGKFTSEAKYKEMFRGA